MVFAIRDIFLPENYKLSLRNLDIWLKIFYFARAIKPNYETLYAA